MILSRFLLCILLLGIFLPTSSSSVAKKSDVQSIETPLAILIGRVSSTSSLVRLEKLYGSAQTLPQQSEYLVGTIYQFRIDEVVKRTKTIRSGQTISVLIPGPANVSDRVVLFSQRKYLVQLSALDHDAEKYKGTVVMDLAHPSAAKQPFDPHNVFTLTSDVHSAVPITEGNKGLIERIRREAKTR